MEKRLIEMEKRIAFAERMIADLNEELLEQQKHIKALQIQLKNFKDRIDSGDLVKKQEDETPPPHY
ncbi:MAG: SlyX family protein [Candidatus Omnitrophota bacterium]